MPTEPKPGEVWFADLGMVEKSRPVLVLAYPEPADARALVIVAPLTSQIRGQRGEVPCPSLVPAAVPARPGDLQPHGIVLCRPFPALSGLHVPIASVGSRLVSGK